MSTDKRDRPHAEAPEGVSVRLERGDVSIGARVPGIGEEQHFLEELRRMGVDTSDLDRSLADFMDELGVIECVAVAEAVWGVELGPRSGTVSEMGVLAYEWPTLRALIAAANSATSAR